MSVYYLGANDFANENGHLAANIGGISFVMFHSQRCSHCINFLPEFKMLPSSIRVINFCVCSVDEANTSIVQKSRDTSTPISAVPKFILYNDGIPYVEYSGQRSRQAVTQFLQEIIGQLNQKQSFTRPRRSRQQEAGGLQPAPGTAPGLSRPAGVPGPAHGGSPAGPASAAPANKRYTITPSTGVKEYESSYGRPYNTLNEQEFLEYESAYMEKMGGAKKK